MSADEGEESRTVTGGTSTPLDLGTDKFMLLKIHRTSPAFPLSRRGKSDVTGENGLTATAAQ
jgi:hypothetical protein